MCDDNWRKRGFFFPPSHCRGVCGRRGLILLWNFVSIMPYMMNVGAVADNNERKWDIFRLMVCLAELVHIVSVNNLLGKWRWIPLYPIYLSMNEGWMRHVSGGGVVWHKMADFNLEEKKLMNMITISTVIGSIFLIYSLKYSELYNGYLWNLLLTTKYYSYTLVNIASRIQMQS